MDLKRYIRDIPDFPKKGIIFKDITPLLRDKNAFRQVIDILYEKVKDQDIDYVVSVESRGFIFGAPLAYRLGCGFIPVRKPGKLPYKTIDFCYEKEYGEDTLCMHQDALEPGSRIVIVDDLLATGGTIQATVGLVEKLGGNIVSILFVIELGFLKGREKLSRYKPESLIKY
ncbi:MAG: adenine phosphoribosyltransferase [Candidatus Altiarchaeota archaeon]|nr:adenine phosphoribosyltransferase [Candidatus Altiarchaeota archaeon]